MSNTASCDRCGAVLAKNRPGSLCPRCVLEEAVDLEVPTEEAADPAADDSLGDRAHGNDSMEGSRIDRYKILERIGEGGFGVVYMASQTGAVHRRVALKILKAGMDTKQVIARFEAERQALAMMDHPNIARVFDAGGTEQGRPYFVMELVKGIPLSQFCREESLDTGARLRLFIQVCRAVQHAHLKGIIHRDLKPSNVLVTLHDGDAVPKVIDFGIAKAMDQELTEKTLFTRYAQIIGTPAYMSPEQAALSGLDVDTRSDVYALGVLLYEILTGTTPFDAETLRQAAFDEMRRIIREDEPPRPSVRLTSLQSEERAGKRIESLAVPASEVARDLDWIVMKALEKDRSRRYETAGGLAQDVERFMGNEPVEAGPPGLRYKLGKFVRRHRLPVAAAAFTAGALVAGMALATWGMYRASVAEEEARTAEEVAREEAEAAASARDVEAAMNAFLLEDLLGQASPYESVEPDLKLRTVLDRASTKLAERFSGEPLLEAEMRMKLAEVYEALGAGPSFNHFERAVKLFTSELGPEAEETLRARHGAARHLVTDSEGLSHIATSNTTVRLEALERVLEDQVRLLGTAHPDTIATKESMAWISIVLLDKSRKSSALELSQDVVESRRQRLGEYHPTTIEAVLLHAKWLSLNGDHWVAEKQLREMLPALEVATAPYPHLKHKVLDELGTLDRRQGELEAAAENYRRALALSEKIHGQFSVDTRKSLRNLLRVAKRGEAITLAQERIAIVIEKGVLMNTWQLGEAFRMVEVLSARGSFSEAANLHSRLAAAFPDKQPYATSGFIVKYDVDTTRSQMEAAPGFLARATLNAMMSGDLDLYEQCRDRLSAKFDRLDDPVFEEKPWLAGQIALLLLLWPGEGEQMELATRLAEMARANENKTQLRRKWNDIAVGLVSYREGAHLQTIECLEPSLEEGELFEEHDGSLAAALAICSLAHAGLGQMKEAERVYREARAWTEVAFSLDYSVRGWSAWAAACILLNHCESALKGDSVASLSDNARYWRRYIDPAPPPVEVVTLVEPTSQWRYLHLPDGTDPSDADPDFFESFFMPDFDDAGWEEGTDSSEAPFGFGYGDPVAVPLETPEAGHRHSAYFRHRFTTDNAVDRLWLRLNYDDGVIIFLDGEEVVRFAIEPEAKIAHQLKTYGHHAMGSGEEYRFQLFEIDRRLEAGDHVLAISVHNCLPDSSDLRLAGVTLSGLPARVESGEEGDRSLSTTEGVAKEE